MSYIKTSTGTLLLTACLLLSLFLIFSSARQFDTVTVSFNHYQNISPRTQLAQISGSGSGLVAHYAFDDGSGTTAGDPSGNNNTGTLAPSVGGPTWNTTDKKVGNGALQFDGVDDYVIVSDNVTLDGFSEFTISLWGSQRVAVSGGGLVRKFVGQSGQRSYDMYTTLTDEIGIELSSNGSTREADASANNCGFTSNTTWTLVTITFKAGAISYYKNGVLCDVDGSAVTTIFNSPVALVLGSNKDQAWFNGSMDDVRIYNRALPAAEVAQLYALGGDTIPPDDVIPPTTGTTNPTNGTYTVKKDGSGNFSTIQACATVVKSGETCEVYTGNYTNEKIIVSANTGTANKKIIFKANGSVVSNGFDVRTGIDYVRIEGFDFTGPVIDYSFMVVTRGVGHEIVGNTFHDPITGDADAIGIGGSSTLIANNTIYNWPIGTAINVGGVGHTIENNIIKDSQDIDVFRVFGHDHVIRKNTILNITDGPKGNHMDFIQAFGQTGTQSYNILVESNFVDGLTGGLAQFEQGCGLEPSGANGLGNNCTLMYGVNGVITSLTQTSLTNSSVNWFTGNWGTNHWSDAVVSIVNSSSGAFGKVYLISSSNSNTLTVTNIDGSSANLTSDGVKVGDSFQIRMRVGWYTFKNNVFKDITGAASLSLPYVKFINNTGVRSKGTSLGGSDDRGWSFHMQNINNINLGYSPDDYLIPTFYADYNYSGNDTTSPPSFAPAPSHRCTAPWLVGEYSQFFNCETFFGKHGINGGDPKFQNFNDPLGPDRIAFTLDDGLKPLPTSPLCSKGQGGTDIGAYSCNPNTVLAGSSGVVTPAPTNGLCSSTLNVCTTGILSNTADSSTQYLWSCLGSNGGTTASCSLPITVTPPVDTDLDLIPDTTDLCPLTPVNMRSFVNIHGCPKPKALNFTIKPNFDSLDLRSVTNLELGTTHGRVSFIDPVVLLKDRTTYKDQLDLDANITITNNKVVINSTNAPELNKRAAITLNNLTFTTPKILRDGVICTTCTIYSYTNGTLIFTVPGFSTYEAAETTPGTPVTPTAPVGTPVPGRVGSITSGSPAIQCVPGTVTPDPSLRSGPAAFTTSMTIGATGESVRQLQIFLNTKGFTVSTTGGGSRGNETTYFGPATMRALAQFQAANNITPAVGFFGPITRAKVNYLNTTSSGSTVCPTPPSSVLTTPASFTRTLSQGMTGNDVKLLQVYLNTHNFVIANTGAGSPGNETTYFGPATKAALIRFQEANRSSILTPIGLTNGTGVFGPATRGVVGR